MEINKIKINGVNCVPVYIIINETACINALRNIAVNRIGNYNPKSNSNNGFSSRIKVFYNDSHWLGQYQGFTETSNSYNLMNWIKQQERKALY